MMDVADELSIRNLIARVAWLTDHWSTTAEYLANYTSDCVWHLEGTEPYVGHQGMSQRLEEMLAAGVCGPGLPTRHCVTSLEVIAGATPDEATARAFVIMTTMKNGEPAIEGYGEYCDRVVRRDGRWLIAHRHGTAFWK